MARTLFPAVPRICRHCGGAWIQADGRPPREYCTTSCRQEAERQARGVAPALPEAVDPEPPRVYTRRVRAKAYTITCRWCGTVVTLEQYPGPAPRYCDPVCREAAAREAAAERMRRMRARRLLPADQQPARRT
jgi:hypothetical protein